MLLVVTPVSVFGMLVSAQALTVTMFGGVGTVWGPVIGAAILIPTAEILHAELGHVIPGIQGVIFGLAIVIVILVAPEGLFWKMRDFVYRRWPRLVRRARQTIRRRAPARMPCATASAEADRAATPGEAVLSACAASRKSFGGLKAVQDVSFEVAEGAILGIIGPNGAGKTTVFNLLNGFLEPDAGEILLDGRNMVGRKPHELCAGRRRTHLPDHAAVRAHDGGRQRRHRRLRACARRRGGAAARRRGDRPGRPDGRSPTASPASSPPSELRLMELARALAGQPRILLLDETLAGLGHNEAEEVDRASSAGSPRTASPS